MRRCVPTAEEGKGAAGHDTLLEVPQVQTGVLALDLHTLSLIFAQLSSAMRCKDLPRVCRTFRMALRNSGILPAQAMGHARPLTRACLHT